MRPFEWQLLVMKETIGEQRVIGGHCYLHRLYDALKLLDALEHFLHTG